MALFQPCPCPGLFAQPVNGLVVSLAILRASGSQTSAGEWTNVFSQVGTVTGSLQPRPSGYTRGVQGTIREVAFTFFVPGNPDIQEGDRAVVSATTIEVIDVERWLPGHTEIEFSHIGR